MRNHIQTHCVTSHIIERNAHRFAANHPVAVSNKIYRTTNHIPGALIVYIYIETRVSMLKQTILNIYSTGKHNISIRVCIGAKLYTQTKASDTRSLN